MYKYFFNGKFHTFSNDKPFCTAVFTLNDRIIFCGNDNEINLPGCKIEKINLDGKNVYPGFIDSHTHIALQALYTERVTLDECNSLSEALSKINAFVSNVEAGIWILGGGWDPNIWIDGRPNKAHLDNISLNNPIALYSKDYHSQWLNSKALELCGFRKNITDPRGGKLERDDTGELTGLVFEKACSIVSRTSGEVSSDQLKRCLDNIYPKIHSMGITSVNSCESLNIFKIFQELALNKQLKLRICMHPPAIDVNKITEAGLFSGFGNEWLRIGGLKYFVDGALGSQTAEMFNNYEKLDHAGIGVMTEDELMQQISHAAAHNLSATIHAIGDKANNKSLNAIEKAQQIQSNIQLRHRIEHCQILKESDIDRFCKLNVIASMQPIHIADDVKISNRYLGERAATAYQINKLIQSGSKVVFGSDMPVADPDPLKGMLAAVSRRYKLDANEPVWYENECVSSYEALLAYTINAAYSSYEENLKGSLSPGKLADFVVLSENINDADEQLLRNTKVLMTVLGSKIVYGD